MPEEYAGIGKCIDRTVAQALQKFHDDYADDQFITDTVALLVSDVSFEGRLQRGGGLEVSAVVIGYKQWQQSAVLSNYSRKQRGRWRLVSEAG